MNRQICISLPKCLIVLRVCAFGFMDDKRNPGHTEAEIHKSKAVLMGHPV